MKIPILQYIIAVFCIIIIGCNNGQSEEKIWEDVKIGDIAPIDSRQTGIGSMLQTINFKTFIFEIPVENFNAVNGVWPLLHTRQLRFNDYESFRLNGFVAGFGQVQIWNNVRNVLVEAKTQNSRSVTMLLNDGQADLLEVTRLYEQKSVYQQPFG